ncbi:diguanylate cyclase [Marinomonas profundimaris]|uniref:diguanylate cyclase n=1 Tax=Marinomonas profundimaris TaxID=1208321 RepID=W1RSB8_9GAMM|nr:diguanylate cyclase [Marinomonas profundimaris]ETI59690.1 diguanylate cyclase [Marinomonas profundimaris]
MTASCRFTFRLMMLIFPFWLMPSLTFAAIPTLVIEGDTVKLEQFQMGYFVDSTEKMSFPEVQRQDFQPSSNSVSLGLEAKTTWAQIKLENVNSTALKLYLHDPYAYHNHILELYEVVDGKLTRQRILDMDRKETQQWMYRGSAVFDITLPPKSHKTLYIRSVSSSHQWFSLSLYDEDDSKRALLTLFTDIALLVGVLLALMVYNLLLFLSSRLREHFFYACYLVSGGFWIALTYGLLGNLFDVYGTMTLKWHLSLGAMPIFLLLFMIHIFETKKKYPIEHWALLLNISLLVANAIYGLFDIVTALSYSSTLAAIMMIISLSVTLSMLIRKHPMALFFLLGHGLFVFFSSLSVLFYKGMVEFNYINSHGVGIGIMVEALVLSLIIAYRIRMLENLKVAQVELKLLASTDSLTQLFNRRHFSNEANAILEKNQRAKEAITVTVLDIDFFKKINDAYGHGLGDKVIIRVADALRAQCRRQDIFARYGGEEFVILMPNTYLNEAYTLAERIRQELENVVIPIDQQQSVSFTVSIGIAEVDAETPDLQAAINRADKALYKAKNNGRNQSQRFSP